MLKRFMNWLLHRLQRVLGALGGKRSGGDTTTASQSTAPQSDLLSETRRLTDQQQPDSSAYSRPQEAAKDLLDEGSPFLEPTERKIERKTPVDLNAAEPDTHQRLNASAAAMPGVGNVTPSFPTEVSELISSASTTSQPAPAKQEIEQLPEIHDLLPAVEASESDEPPSESAASDTQVSAALDESPNLQADSLQLEDLTPLSPSTQSEAPSPQSEVSATQLSSASNEDVAETESAESTAAPAQAMLFSFDITESEAEPASDHLSGSPTEAPSVDSRPETVDEAVPEPSETVEAQSLDDVLDSSDVAVDDGGNRSLSTPAEPPIPIKDAPVSEASDASSSAVQDLPYPWSIAAARASVRPTEKTPVEESDKPSVTQSEEAVESVNENRPESATDQSDYSSLTPLVPNSNPFKNGVVKLLFTLKHGNYHGYIAPDDGSQDILFHQKYINADIFDRLERGDKVVVSIKYIEGKAYATRVDLR